MSAVIDEAIIKIVAAKKQMMKTCDDALATIFKEIFNKYPRINTIYWAQYTPYFNDGEECVFSVNDVHFTSKNWKDVHRPYDDDECFEVTVWNNEKNKFTMRDDVSEEMFDDMKKITKLLQGDLEDHLRLAYDDHVFVRVHRNATEITEHDHE